MTECDNVVATLNRGCIWSLDEDNLAGTSLVAGRFSASGSPCNPPVWHDLYTIEIIHADERT